MSEILIGKNDHANVALDPRFGNRHRMIAGATGTGKSVSLMVLAEGFSWLGVPAQEAATQAWGSGWGGAMHDAIFGSKRRQGMIETMGKQVVRIMGSQIGRQNLHGVLGGIFGGKSR